MPVHLSFATRSHVGRVRSRNEDSVASDPDSGLLVVADGMGGHPAGDIASRLAAEEVLRLLSAGTNLGSDTGEGMAEAVRAADERIRREGRNNRERTGMGTTITAMQVDRSTERFVIGHLGDSRAYRWRGETLERLTRDDTWVQDQVEAGRLTEEQARRHRWSSVLTRALGLEHPAEPAIVEGGVRPGDLYLLCSDGLTAMLTDDEVGRVLRTAGTAEIQQVTDALVDGANQRGGVDNITVGIVAVTAPG